ncbi:MAG: ribosomal L7Ae/L30e/S12e/Gadd45 family protein [Clostridia bacterium]|nr:ribosomal L7Ae/L30e/S12e/Gadd45 family protein [Clostridia bacterium]
MSKERIAGALGLVCRAGRITTGVYLVKEEIRKGKAAVVLLASDAAENAEKKIASLAEHRGVPVKRISLTKAEFGQCLGKQAETVCASVPHEFLNLVLASL